MKTLCLLGVCALSAGQAIGAEFINLGFDEMMTNQMQFFSAPFPFEFLTGRGPVSEVLQGWRFFQGTNEVESAIYNRFPMNPGFAIVYAAEAIPMAVDLSLPRPEGKHALLVTGLYDGQGVSSLIQSGEVPARARVVQYRLRGAGFRVFANGEELRFLNPAEWGTFAYNTLAAFDVSEYAGQEIELKLTMYEPPMGHTSSALDSIEFVAAEPPNLTVGAQGGELAVTFVALDTEWLVEGARELGGSWERVTILKKGSTGFTHPLSGPLRFFRLRLGWDAIPPMAARSVNATMPVKKVE